ncbi:UvrD-helicase domain-containing protein [Metabacillus litoralis]|uniref:UvrD-helicase domain-containing protein n=1 Tax=Metabacillus litoralis TaxID=152268 RepID=UPI001CFF1EC7|nr:UvrD-helicase domain-containing protein [Metabacillus litoralis]
MINYIVNYFQQTKTKKQLKEIKQTVADLHMFFKKFEKQVEALSHQRTLITDDQITFLKNKYINEIKNLKFSSLSQQIINIKVHEKKLQQLEEMVSMIQTKTHSIHNELPDIQRTVNTTIKTYKDDINSFKKKIVGNRQVYFTSSQREDIRTSFKETYDFFSVSNQDHVVDKEIKGFLHFYENLDDSVEKWNKEFIQKELATYEAFFNDIDGKSLDLQQRTAIVTDEDSNLILAGAGSGKTLTISGKVKYLVEKKQVKPEEILLISFTKKAAEEMNERISNRLGLKVTVNTFHKLGLDIISKNTNNKPDVFQNMTSLLDDYFHKEIYKDKELIQKLMTFFGYFLNIPKDIDEFEDLGEYHEHYRNVDFETLKGKKDKMDRYLSEQTNKLKNQYMTYSGETVKSIEEFIIANFLFLNGISYKYEHPYPFHEENQTYRHYKPDFYLPDYDLYIEHFGITENNTAPWLSKIEEAKYIDGIVWKRSKHKEHGTTLIESYSYYNKQGVLLEKLEQNLKNHHVEFKKIDYYELFSSIYDSTNDPYFTEFKKLISTFLNLFKSNGYEATKFDEFKQHQQSIQHPFSQKRSNLFFELVKPIFTYYENYLKKHKQIDFNDMINIATDIVIQQDITFPYKYIMIDEYQDISKSRYHLIKAIREKTNAKIMCVGDDWQSIYRFAGSDIQLFTNFGDYFGHYELLKMEKTYRNSQELINIAGDFVMKNPIQFKKNLTSNKLKEQPIRVLGYKRDLLDSLKQALEEVVKAFGENSSVMLLGRNNFDIQRLIGGSSFHIKDNRSEGTKQIVYQKYPKLKITFLTAHRSKGLEAENVIIINGQNSSVGFPNKISDDPILSWVLNEQESYWFAEERRLFYVALTRTQNTTYVLAPEQKQSSFVKELRSNYNITYETNEKSILDNPPCPKCKSGQLTIRENAGNRNHFLGCTNFPGCDYTIKNVELLNQPITCPLCDGYMVRRKGRYGEFYGCNHYPRCEGKMKI